MKRIALLAVIGTALPSAALAWNHIGMNPTEDGFGRAGWAWGPESQPIPFWVADNGEATTDCEESVPAGYCTTAAIEGFAAWNDAECADIAAEYQGVTENINGFREDGVNRILFNDPAGDLASDSGTLAATVCRTNNIITLTFGGRDYYQPTDCDIVFNKDVPYDTHEDIVGGQCQGGSNMLGVMTHEIGHLLGMGHSCGEFDLCNDPLFAEATMYWSGGPCSTDQADINDDDIDGITALYGPYATFTCSNLVDDEGTTAVGNVPFTLKCTVESDYLEEIVSAEWNFGDGGYETTFPHATHEYTEAGNYTVRVTFTGERAACDEWKNTFRRVGYVRACDVPDAAFTVAHKDGLTYTLLNETDVSTFGCIQDIQWDVYKGGSAPNCEPINKCEVTEAVGTNGCIRVPSLPAATAPDEDWEAYDEAKKIWDVEKAKFDECADGGGKRIASLGAWEPEFTFPDEDEYTIVLNVHGRAGTGSAELTFNATKRPGEGRACSYLGAGSATGFGIFSLALIGLRRRRG